MYALTGPIEDLLQQPITERSVNAMLHCPFHEDRTPSFSIHLDEGVWHCFSCQDSGTLKGLYRRLGHDGVDDSVRLIQAKRNAEEPDIRTKDFSPKSNSDLRGLDSERGRRFLDDFIASRGILREVAESYGLGYDVERDALSFPYRDTEGRVTGIKYRFHNGFKASEPGSHYGLFGLSDAIGKEEVIICEGESDTLRVKSEVGSRYGVAGTSGASVSDTQWSSIGLHLLFAKRIYLCYDGDGAGDKCAEAGMRMLGSDKCIQLRPSDGYDATDWLESGHTLQELGLE